MAIFDKKNTLYKCRSNNSGGRMSVALASSIYDMAKGSIFGVRNVDKTAKGDFVRAGVAAGQFRNATRALGECQNGIGKTAKTLSDGFNSLAKEKTILGYTAKGVNFASNWINPLICVSGAVKVIKSDDKDSEAIKQTCALGSMFTFEKTAKSILTEAGRNSLIKKSISKNNAVKKLMGWSEQLDSYAKNSSNKYVKYGIPIAKALGFISMSITGYSIGSTLGDKINEARKSNPQKLIEKVPENKIEISA